MMQWVIILRKDSARRFRRNNEGNRANPARNHRGCRIFEANPSASGSPVLRTCCVPQAQQLAPGSRLRACGSRPSPAAGGAGDTAAFGHFRQKRTSAPRGMGFIYLYVDFLIVTTQTNENDEAVREK